MRDPALILQADSPEAVRRTLVDVEHLTRDRGLHAVGFLTYEAGEAFGLRVHPTRDGALPLAWFGLYPASHVIVTGQPEHSAEYTLGPLVPSVDARAFAAAIARIRTHLLDGDTYQVNYTFRVEGTFAGEAEALFADLVARQQGQYSAYIDLGDTVICSASPELFFEIEGADIVARPMKGTTARGLTLEEDRARAAALATSEKNRAENVMVVDMVRNDLGRVADTGSVRVEGLCTVERYPNVWQMTSTVRGRSLAPLADIFEALHPSASITGAPKVRTMELLRELESSPRGVYTGAIGHVPPDGLARFNVAIRTAVIERTRGHVSFGVGSGVVWDSVAEAEYAECLLKASVLGQRAEPFDLLETLLWTEADGFALLDRHLDRLTDSAAYFGVPVDRRAIEEALRAAVDEQSGARRVRLLVGPTGVPRVEHQPHAPHPDVMRVGLAPFPVDATDRFLFHKTTRRDVYSRARAAVPGVDEVLLWNGRAEVTEATTMNVIVELDGMRWTPPVACGLLPGTWRGRLLDAGLVRERVIAVQELDRATGIWLVNSVHGERRVELVQR